MHPKTVLCAGVALALAAGAALADTQSFQVNAQYRGMVKKAFTDIGTGELNDSGSNQSFRLSGRADVDHPRQEGKTYRLALDMAFRMHAGTIEEVANRSHCNPGSEEALNYTEKLVPFVHLVKNLPLEELNGATFTTPRGTFQVGIGHTERNTEATIYENGRMAGKFFLSNAETTPRQLEKFRITTKGGTVLSFVATPNVAAR